MRLSHLLFAVFLIALALTISRDPAGRVALIVFIVGIGVFVAALTAVMALFQTVGSLGEARTLLEHLEALLATLVVSCLGATIVAGLMWLGGILILHSVD